MCLTTRNLDIIKADEDIDVFKTMKVTFTLKNGKLKWKVESPMYPKEWMYGTNIELHRRRIKEVDFGITHHEDWNIYYIDEGYHSYIDAFQVQAPSMDDIVELVVLNVSNYGSDERFITFLATIPKGTDYVIRLRDKEVVSRKLILSPQIVIHEDDSLYTEHFQELLIDICNKLNIEYNKGD